MRKLQVGPLRHAGAWTIVPVELAIAHASADEGRVQGFATKRPHALVLIGQEGTRAFDAEGGDVSVTELVAETPGLETILRDAGAGLAPNGSA